MLRLFIENYRYLKNVLLHTIQRVIIFFQHYPLSTAFCIWNFYPATVSALFRAPCLGARYNIFWKIVMCTINTKIIGQKSHTIPSVYELSSFVRPTADFTLRNNGSHTAHGPRVNARLTANQNWYVTQHYNKQCMILTDATELFFSPGLWGLLLHIVGVAVPVRR